MLQSDPTICYTTNTLHMTTSFLRLSPNFALTAQTQSLEVMQQEGCIIQTCPGSDRMLINNVEKTRRALKCVSNWLLRSEFDGRPSKPTLCTLPKQLFIYTLNSKVTMATL